MIVLYRWSLGVEIVSGWVSIGLSLRVWPVRVLTEDCPKDGEIHDSVLHWLKRLDPESSPAEKGRAFEFECAPSYQYLYL